MGCDVHIHVEVKMGGSWLHYHHPIMRRNYSAFAKLAGVRGVDEPIVPPRGMPDDVSEITRVDAVRWKVDGHTYSWLNRPEMKEFFSWYAGTDGYLANGDCLVFGDVEFICEYPEDYPWAEDIRMVFWFDS